MSKRPSFNSRLKFAGKEIGLLEVFIITEDCIDCFSDKNFKVPFERVSLNALSTTIEQRIAENTYPIVITLENTDSLLSTINRHECYEFYPFDPHLMPVFEQFLNKQSETMHAFQEGRLELITPSGRYLETYQSLKEQRENAENIFSTLKENILKSISEIGVGALDLNWQPKYAHDHEAKPFEFELNLQGLGALSVRRANNQKYHFRLEVAPIIESQHEGLFLSIVAEFDNEAPVVLLDDFRFSNLNPTKIIEKSFVLPSPPKISCYSFHPQKG